MPAKKAEKTEQEMTFEQMEKRLQEIVAQIDSNEIGLDQKIALGEEGRKLLDKMDSTLAELQKKVDAITKIDVDEEQN